MRRGNIGAVLVLPLAAAMTLGAQTQQASLTTSAMRRINATPMDVSYEDGQLNIVAVNTSLGSVLRKVAELTGAKIEIPSEANTELVPILKLGPGAPRAIV